MPKSDLPSIATELYKLLEPHEPDIRARAIQAAIVMLGGNTNVTTHQNQFPHDEGEAGGKASQMPPKVEAWMRSHGITLEQLEQVFHLYGDVCEVLPSEAPGKNGKEKTINAYILTGIAAFLESGETKFDDKTARGVCRAMGCLNEGNHAYYMKGKGNLLGGTKDSGWMLTGPGLKLGAELIKGLTREIGDQT